MSTPDSLRIWILQNGEEIASDPGPPRLLRQGILASLLAKRGHDVTYWTSTYNHQQRAQRTTPRVHTVPAGYRIRLLPARSYARNLSIDRIRSHREAAAAFVREARHEAVPDVVICGYPTIELAFAGTSYATAQGIPSLVDFRDQWPDIIEQQLGGLRLAGAPILAHWRRLQVRTVQSATSVCGITDEFVDWALSCAARPRTELDRAFPLAPPVTAVTVDDLQAARDYWLETLGSKLPGSVWCVFAGGLGHRSDILTVVRAMRDLDPAARTALRLVVCGAGDLSEDVAREARGRSGVSFVGWRNAAEVAAILEMADVGVLPYPNTSDFLMSFPNKVGEYLSHGLPVLTSLGGVTGRLLDDHDLALCYAEGDERSCQEALSTVAASGVSEDRRARARALHREHFDPDVVYPAYADHVERVASVR